MALPLFDEAGADDVEDISKVEIDKEFARRFEHNKRREDLQRLEELRKRGEVPDSSESSESTSEEEEDGPVGSRKKDIQFYDAIVRIKRNDPAIYRKDTKLYSDEEEEEGEGEEARPKTKKEKPLYIKDVVAKRLIVEGPELEDDELLRTEKVPSRSYVEEQEENKRAFLEAAEGGLGSDGEDVFKEKKKSGTEQIVDENEGEVQKKLAEYFGEDGSLDENEMFLKNFLLNKMWIDKDKGKKPLDEEFLAVSEEENELDKQDKYETEYNFRYEEGAEDRVLGHSRVTEGSVRKKTNARKLQRMSKEERMAQAEFERKEELKRLKNLKKKEIQEKLDKIRKIAGISEGGHCVLDEDDLEEFDPEEYDRKMKEVFDADYYDAEDADPGFGSGGDDDMEKPDFDEEDELLGLPRGWDADDSPGGFSAVRKRIMQTKLERGGEGGECEKEEEKDLQTESKRKRKRKISLHEKVELEKELEEYYKLNYEDTIGDLKTRFRYKSVQPNRYGLSAEEILMAEDKELNQYVSLKKIAPYREDEWKVSRLKRYHQKMKKKLLLQGGNIDGGKIAKRMKMDGSASMEPGMKPLPEELKGEQSKSSRRRRRHAELKLSQSRLMAYGKIQQKSKNKKKC